MDTAEEAEPGDGSFGTEMIGGTSTGHIVQYEERDMCFEQDYSDSGDGIDDIENAAIDEMYAVQDGDAVTGGDGVADGSGDGGDGDNVETVPLAVSDPRAERLILDRINTGDLL